MGVTPYHPSYGYTDEFRLRVVEHSWAVSPADAARTFNVSLSSVYYWRAHYKAVTGCHRN